MIDILKEELLRPEYAGKTIFEIEKIINDKIINVEKPIKLTLVDLSAFLSTESLSKVVTHPRFNDFSLAIANADTQSIFVWVSILVATGTIKQDEALAISNEYKKTVSSLISRAEQLGLSEVGIGMLNLAGVTIPEVSNGN